jgi:peptidyl-dipeptidase A
MSDSLPQFIEDLVTTLAPMQRAANDTYWKFTTTGDKKYEEEVTRLQIALRKVFADPARFAELKRLTAAGEATSDPLLARQATLLTQAFTGNQMDDATIEELTHREIAIESIFNSFRAELNGKKVTENELKELLRDAHDVAVRREAWEASKQVGSEVAGKLVELVEMRNAIARRIGFDDFYRMHLILQELDETELFTTFDELDRLARPVYTRYKAELDGQLAGLYGVQPADLRPWHYADPFFQEAPAADPTVRQFLADAYKSQNIEALTRCFYKSIGLVVDDVLTRSDLYEREGKQQHAYCMNVDRAQDVRILANIKPNEQWMGTMLHESGHAVYDKNIDPSLPFLLREPAHTLFTEAIAMLMGRLSSDPAWLLEYVPGVSAQDVDTLAPKLRKQVAGQLIIMSRWIPVMSQFERALYTNPRQDLNTLWWDIEERWQMVPRPEGRHAPDWAAKIHFSIAPVYYHNYLMGEMIASQIRHYVDTQIPGVGADPGRRFVTDPAVGHYLTERIFRPGARRIWYEALEHATGERLRPHYFVAQASV